MRYGFAVLVLSGCVGSAGPQGDRGPAGAEGAQGPAGERGEVGPQGLSAVRGLQWVDATGALVGDQLTYVDAAGVLWPIDPETASVRLVDLHLTSNRLYTSTDCSGVAYVVAPAPRQAFDMVDDPTLRVRRDTAMRTVIDAGSGFGGGTCTQITGTRAGLVSFADMDVVLMPSLGFVPPLHREQR